MESALIALGEHPYKRVRVPNRGIIVSAKSYKDGIEDEIIPKLKEFVGSYDIRRFIKDKSGRPATVEWRSGSITHLMSAEQEDVAFESKTIDWAWIDEPVRRNIYIALLRGLMKAEGLLWITATPLEQPWIYDEIYLPGVSGEDKQIEVFEGISGENVHVGEQGRQLLYGHLTADELTVRKGGKFPHLTGRVIKEYDWTRHRIPPFNIPPHWPVWLSIDPHKNKPHAALWMAVSHLNSKYLCNEVFHRCTIKELGYIILDMNQQYNMVNVLIDTSAQEEDWRKESARSMLDEIGVRTKLAQKNNLKNAGIHLINQGFHDDQLFVFEPMHRTHKELTLWVYKQNKRDKQQVLEEPEKKYDDMMDNLRYILVEKPEYSGVAGIKDYIQGANQITEEDDGEE